MPSLGSPALVFFGGGEGSRGGPVAGQEVPNRLLWGTFRPIFWFLLQPKILHGLPFNRTFRFPSVSRFPSDFLPQLPNLSREDRLITLAIRRLPLSYKPEPIA